MWSADKIFWSFSRVVAAFFADVDIAFDAWKSASFITSLVPESNLDRRIPGVLSSDAPPH